MKTLALVLGALAVVAAPAVLAQDNSDRNYPFDPYEVERQQWREAQRQDRWNDPRYGDYRDDRGDRYFDRRIEGVNRDRVRQWDYYARRGGFECWNPRIGRFEDVRTGGFQDDLDYSRCRPEFDRYDWRR